MPVPTQTHIDLRSSSQVASAVDFSAVPDVPSFADRARFNQPRDVPDIRFGEKHQKDAEPVATVLQPYHQTTTAENYVGDVVEKTIYRSSEYPLEENKVVRRPHEVNQIIFDHDHAFGYTEAKGISAAETLKPVHPAPALQTTSDPARFGFDGADRLNHLRCTTVLQHQDPSRTELDHSVNRCYDRNSYNPNERFGELSTKKIDDTVSACVNHGAGLGEEVPFSAEKMSVHRVEQVDRFAKTNIGIGVSNLALTSSVDRDAVYGISTRYGDSVSSAVRNAQFDDMGTAVGITQGERAKERIYGYAIPDVVFGETKGIDRQSTKPCTIGGDPDGTDFGVANNMDLYKPVR